jgi:hypothetical protein
MLVRHANRIMIMLSLVGFALWTSKRTKLQVFVAEWEMLVEWICTDFGIPFATDMSHISTVIDLITLGIFESLVP